MKCCSWETKLYVMLKFVGWSLCATPSMYAVVWNVPCDTVIGSEDFRNFTFVWRVVSMGKGSHTLKVSPSGMALAFTLRLKVSCHL